MLRIKLLNTRKKIENAISADDSLLIIGRGESDYKLREIESHSSKENVRILYRNSELCDAFCTAYDMGAKNIYLINIQNISDYIEIVDTIKQYNFAYIVPLDITISDTFFHAELKRQVSFAEYYLSSISNYCSSLIVFTDNHASLYEDIDDYLIDMRNKITKFKLVSEGALKAHGRNICIVANNLKEHKHSNLLLATALSVSDYAEYPNFDFGEAVLDIDYFDIRSLELIYFKNNDLKNTSVENLKNLRPENDADKLILIDKIIKYIERNLDLTKYNGKLFSEYVKFQVYTELGDFLSNIKGKLIRDYKINSIDFIKNNNHTGILVNNFEIVPINSIEEFNILTEV